MFFFRNLLIAVFAIFLPLNSVFSQELIENSYIISFKEDAGVIDPPNPENKGKVPVGQPTSGQNKDELAVQLGLDGKIVAILEANNKIVVEISAEEAERWRQDERVQRVEQGKLGVFADIIRIQTDYPVYRDDILIVPRVDTDEQTGQFQDGVFQYDPAVDAWRLLEYRIVPISQIFLVEEDGVEAIVTDTLPVQVLLKVNGNFHSSCGRLGRIDQRREGNRFEVLVNVVGDGIGACYTALVPFEKFIPLDVYGLPAGTYEYSVNGERTGTFELITDNNLTP